MGPPPAWHTHMPTPDPPWMVKGGNISLNPEPLPAQAAERAFVELLPLYPRVMGGLCPWSCHGKGGTRTVPEPRVKPLPQGCCQQYPHLHAAA